MAIVQTVYKSDFVDAFIHAGRSSNFSVRAREMLFDYLEEYSDSTGEPVELDVIALCCDYNEDHWSDIADNYSIDLSDCDDEDEKIETVREYLEDNTCLIGETYDGAFLYQAF
jgi:hypothetical protein